MNPEAVEHGHDRRLGKCAGERAERPLEPGRLRRDDHDVGLGQRARLCRSAQARVQSALPAHAQALPLERFGVLTSAGEHRDLADLRQMPGEEAPDDPRADDADPFDHAGAIIPCRDMSVNSYASARACGSRAA
jgi:hypothetical protein